VNQSETAFGKARGIAIARVKAALENGGFSLPEPIYRLRVDGAVSDGLTLSETTREAQNPEAPEPEHKDISTAEAEDVTPDHHLDEKVTEERAEQGEKDLLDQSRPVE
jgi:small conductance mechanosensitive channel